MKLRYVFFIIILIGKTIITSQTTESKLPVSFKKSVSDRITVMSHERSLRFDIKKAYEQGLKNIEELRYEELSKNESLIYIQVLANQMHEYYALLEQENQELQDLERMNPSCFYELQSLGCGRVRTFRCFSPLKK